MLFSNQLKIKDKNTLKSNIKINSILARVWQIKQRRKQMRGGTERNEIIL